MSLKDVCSFRGSILFRHLVILSWGFSDEPKILKSTSEHHVWFKDIQSSPKCETTPVIKSVITKFSLVSPERLSKVLFEVISAKNQLTEARREKGIQSKGNSRFLYPKSSEKPLLMS